MMFCLIQNKNKQINCSVTHPIKDKSSKKLILVFGGFGGKGGEMGVEGYKTSSPRVITDEGP